MTSWARLSRPVLSGPGLTLGCDQLALGSLEGPDHSPSALLPLHGEHLVAALQARLGIEAKGPKEGTVCSRRAVASRAVSSRVPASRTQRPQMTPAATAAAAG